MNQVKPKLDVKVAGIQSVSYMLASYFWVSLGLPIVAFFVGAIIYIKPWLPSHHDKHIPLLFDVLFCLLWVLIVVSLLRSLKARQAQGNKSA
jgi:FtsH-binding integral membrane protein